MNKEIKKNFNLKFKLLDNKNLFKDKINTIIDNNNNSKLNTYKELNKSKSDKEFSIFNPNNIGTLSYRNKKNEILLLEHKLGKKPDHPIFLSLMTNKKNFVNSFSKKFQIESNKNTNSSILIKSSSSSKKYPKSIIFDNSNNKFNYLKNKNINNSKSINSNCESIDNFKLNFKKIKNVSKSSNNINSNKKMTKNDEIFKKKKQVNENEIPKNKININIFNMKSKNNSLNNSNSDIYLPNKNNFKQKKQLSSSIYIPLDNSINISTIGHNIKEKKKEINNFNIKDFTIKDKNIKKLLLVPNKENEKTRNSNIINQQSIKLKDIQNFTTISLIEETQKNKFNNNQIINIIPTIQINKKNKDKNTKDLNTDRLVLPYKLKDNNIIMELLNQPVKNLNIIMNEKNNKETTANKTINNHSINNNTNNKDITNQNKSVNNKNNKDKGKTKINKHNNKTKIEKIKKETDDKNNKNYNTNNKNLVDNKFLELFNIKKTIETDSKNNFLNFIHSDIKEKCENIMNKVKDKKLPPLVKATFEIKNIILNEQSTLKKYSYDIKNNLKQFKNEILKNEIKINIDEKYDIIKNKILSYKLFSSYILSFQKFNLSLFFLNYVFKSINFSSIYLPIVKNKKTQKRQALVINNKTFSYNLSNSLYPDIKSKYLLKTNPDKIITLLSNLDSIIKLINIDIDESQNNNIDNKYIRKRLSITINKTIKLNEINNILLDYKNKDLHKDKDIIKRKKTHIDLSFMPQIKSQNSNRNTIYNKICSKRRVSCSYININFKRKIVSHSVLDKKQFFEVPERSYNIKLNSTITKAILYSKICGQNLDDIKKDKNKIIKDIIDNDRNLDELINKKCIEKLRIGITNPIKGKTKLLDNYRILKEIKGKKFIEETLRMLIKEGQDQLFLDYLDKNYKDINLNCLDENNNTFLMLSVKEGLDNIVKALLEKNVDINLKNKNGNTALHYALGNKMFYIADLLKNYGADETLINKNGLTPWECIGKFGVIQK